MRRRRCAGGGRRLILVCGVEARLEQGFDVDFVWKFWLVKS